MLTRLWIALTPLAVIGSTAQGQDDANRALLGSAQKGDLAAARAALHKGASANARDDQRVTPLIKATAYGHRAIARLLLDRGADPNLPDGIGETPLLAAGDPAMVKLLLKRGAWVDAANMAGFTPLMRAAESDEVESMRVLLAHGAEIDARDGVGRSALSEAVEHGQYKAVAYLLTRGADMDAKGQEGKTPLEKAQACNFASIAELFEEERERRIRRKTGAPEQAENILLRYCKALYRDDRHAKGAALFFSTMPPVMWSHKLTSLRQKQRMCTFRYNSVAFTLAYLGIDTHKNTQRLLYCSFPPVFAANPAYIYDTEFSKVVFPAYLRIYRKFGKDDLLGLMLAANCDGAMGEAMDAMLSDLFFRYPAAMIRAATRARWADLTGTQRLADALVQGAGDWKTVHHGTSVQGLSTKQAAKFGAYARVRSVIREECAVPDARQARLARRLSQEFEKGLKAQ